MALVDDEAWLRMQADRCRSGWCRWLGGWLTGSAHVVVLHCGGRIAEEQLGDFVAAAAFGSADLLEGVVDHPPTGMAGAQFLGLFIVADCDVGVSEEQTLPAGRHDHGGEGRVVRDLRGWKRRV